MSEKIKAEDSYMSYTDSGVIFITPHTRYTLSFYIDIWKKNEKIWDYVDRSHSLNQLMKIQGFEEWYDQEYRKTPNLEMFADVMCKIEIGLGNAFVLSMIYDLLSDEQKQKFYKKMKETKK